MTIRKMQKQAYGRNGVIFKAGVFDPKAGANLNAISKYCYEEKLIPVYYFNFIVRGDRCTNGFTSIWGQSQGQDYRRSWDYRH